MALSCATLALALYLPVENPVQITLPQAVRIYLYLIFRGGLIYGRTLRQRPQNVYRHSEAVK